MTNTAEHPSTPAQLGSTVTNLAEFLLARYAERLDVVEHVIDTLSRLPHKPGAISLNGVDVYDPRLELADIEAKRRIVELHHISDEDVYDADGIERPGKDCTECWDEFPCDTLRLLALPYAEHSDYREEWKP